MLYTNLKHIESATDYSKVISENENVVLICGNMSRQSIQTYVLIESLMKKYKNVKFFDMEYDNPESYEIRNLAQSIGAEIPFMAFYKKGIVAKIIKDSPSRNEMKKILDSQFEKQHKNIKDTSILSEENFYT